MSTQNKVSKALLSLVYNSVSNYYKLTKGIYFGIFSSLILAITLTFFYPFILSYHKDNLFIVFGFLVFLSLLILIPAIFIANFLKKSFTGDSNLTRLLIILHSYLGIIFIFASVYFSMNVVGDFIDQREKYFYYTSQISKKSARPYEYQILRANDARPFKNISYPLWSGIERPDGALLLQLEIFYPNQNVCYTCYDNMFLNGTLNETPMEVITNLAKHTMPGDGDSNKINWEMIFKFQRQNAIGNFVDCLYFSVITIATLGYGDISPNIWYTKMTASLEVVCGLVIFVFAVNLLFAKWHNSK